MINLPLTKIADDLSTKRNLANSISHVQKYKSSYLNYSTLEDFTLSLDENNVSAPGFEHHFIQIRRQIIDKLWQNEHFYSVSFVDEIIFTALKADGDVINNILDGFKPFKGVDDIFLIFPLYAFGFMGKGLFNFFTKSNTLNIQNDLKIAICSQANSKDTAYANISHIVSHFDKSLKLEKDSWDHYLRSRPVKWIINNPILLLKTKALNLYPRENQFFYTKKVSFSRLYFYLLASISKPHKEEKRFLFSSTSKINNWQTLDFNHFFILRQSSEYSKFLNFECVPMNFTNYEMVEQVTWNIELYNREWYYRKLLKNDIVNILSKFQSEYFSSTPYKSKNRKAKILEKLFESIQFFMFSFLPSSRKQNAIVQIAVAVEVLLTDYYSIGLHERIIRRTRILLKGIKGNRRMKSEISELIKTRGETLHLGQSEAEISLEIIRHAYSIMLLKILASLDRMDYNLNEPIADVIENKIKSGPIFINL